MKSRADHIKSLTDQIKSKKLIIKIVELTIYRVNWVTEIQWEC